MIKILIFEFSDLPTTPFNLGMILYRGRESYRINRGLTLVRLNKQTSLLKRRTKPFKGI